MPWALLRGNDVTASHYANKTVALTSARRSFCLVLLPHWNADLEDSDK
jgi:hypothetical protein